jgi:hypothetical protein
MIPIHHGTGGLRATTGFIKYFCVDCLSNRLKGKLTPAYTFPSVLQLKIRD